MFKQPFRWRRVVMNVCQTVRRWNRYWTLDDHRLLQIWDMITVPALPNIYPHDRRSRGLSSRMPRDLAHARINDRQRHFSRHGWIFTGTMFLRWTVDISFSIRDNWDNSESAHSPYWSGRDEFFFLKGKLTFLDEMSWHLDRNLSF
jgi:hypothetical protein